MKKLVFMFVMFAAFAFTACFNNPKENVNTEPKDSIEVVENADSTAAAEEVKAEEEATKEEAVKEETPAAEAAPAEEVNK